MLPIVITYDTYFTTQDGRNVGIYEYMMLAWHSNICLNCRYYDLFNSMLYVHIRT